LVDAEQYQDIGFGKTTSSQDGSSSKAGLVEQLKLEQAELIKGHAVLKAKIDLMLASTRSILGLTEDATWRSLMAELQELVAVRDKTANVQPAVLDAQLEGMLLEANLTIQRKEEEIEASEAKARDLEKQKETLEGIIRKQRDLLDSTSRALQCQGNQITKGEQKITEITMDLQAKDRIIGELRERDQKQKDLIENLQATVYSHQDTILVQEAEIVELGAQRRPSSDEVPPENDAHNKSELDFIKRQETQIVELEHLLAQREEELARRDNDSKKQLEEIARSKAELSKHKEETDEKHKEHIQKLCDILDQEKEFSSQYKAELEVYQAAERRKYSYHPSDHKSVDSDNSTGAPTLPRSKQQSGSTSSRPSARSSGEMTGATKHDYLSFISHFPMSSRTERKLRTCAEERKRKPGTPP